MFIHSLPLFVPLGLAIKMNFDALKVLDYNNTHFCVCHTIKSDIALSPSEVTQTFACRGIIGQPTKKTVSDIGGPLKILKLANGQASTVADLKAMLGYFMRTITHFGTGGAPAAPSVTSIVFESYDEIRNVA